MALKGANDSLCIPRDTRILKYTIQCVQKIRKYLFWSQKCQNVNKLENRSFDVALKGAKDSLCIPRDTRNFKYTIQCVKKIRKYFFCTQNG